MPRKAKDDDVIDICTTWLNPECEQINKIQMCDYRYLLHVQGNAWSHSLKHQLACGTVVIFVNPHYTDFFSRALKVHPRFSELYSEETNLHLTRLVSLALRRCALGD